MGGETEADKFEYDDLTLDEQLMSYLLMAIYGSLLIFNLVYFNRLRRENKAFVEKNWVILALMCLALLFRYTVLSRIVYFTDALCPLVMVPPAGQVYCHIIPLIPYWITSSCTYFCVSQFCLLFCQLW